MTTAPTPQVVVEGRVPPHDLPAEGAVLSVVMVDPAALGKIAFLRPEHFFGEAHRRIFEACRGLASTGKPIDVVQVATWLRDNDRLAQVGGMAYLTEVLNEAPTVANVTAYARTVHEKWRGRQLILACQRLTAQGYAGVPSLDELIASGLVDLTSLRHAPDASELLDAASLAAPLPDLQHVVAEIGLVAGGGAPHLIAGFGFSGKTIACQAMLVALAAGEKVWGCCRPRVCRVAHVDLEQGDRLTRRRYQRIARAMGVDLATLGDALAVAIMPPGLALTAACEERWRSIMVGRELLLVDSLRAATGGQDENSSDIRAGLDMLGALSEATGCRALVIHHARKPSADSPGGGRYAIRGSSAIFDGSDSVYVFAAEKGEPIRVEHCKARTHGEPVEDFALVVSDVDLDGEPRAGVEVRMHGAELVSQRREEHANAARRDQTERDARLVRETIAAQPNIGTRDLRAASRLSGDRLTAALHLLGDAVEVIDEGGGRGKSVRHRLRGGAS